MKINFSQNLTALDGSVYKKDKDLPASLGDMCIVALLTEPKDVPVKAEDKLKRWELAKTIYNQSEIDLKVEDIAMIKKLVGVVFAPAIMGAIYDLLETK